MVKLRLLNTHSGFFLKVLASLLILNGLTIAVLIFISYTFTEKSLTTQAQDRTTQALDQLVLQLKQDYIHKVSRILIALENTAIMDDYLRGKSATKLDISRRMERRFLQIQKNYPYYYDIRFVQANGSVGFGIKNGKRNFYLNDDPKTPSKESKLRNELFNFLKGIPLLLSSGNMEWFMPLRELQSRGPELNEQNEHFIVTGLSKLDKDNGEFGGAFFIQLSFNHLLNKIQKISMYGESPIWLLKIDNSIILKPNSEKNHLLDPTPFLPTGLNKDLFITSNNKGVIATRDIQLGDGTQFIRIAFSIPKTLLTQDFEQAFDFFSVVSVLSVLFSILFSFLLSRYLSRPYKELSLARNQLSTAHRLAQLGHWEWNDKTKKIMLSENALAIFDRPLTEKSLSLNEFISYVAPDEREQLKSLLNGAITQQKTSQIDHHLITHNKQELYVHQEIDILNEQNKQIVGTIQNITERRKAELRIQDLAYHDVVTGLANRTLLYQLAKTALSEAIEQKQTLAIMFLDLDHFKRINDTLGHDAGDELLRQVSTRLKTCLRPNDAVSTDPATDFNTVARFGGDEFIILLPNLNEQQDAIKIAHRILKLFQQPFTIKSSKINISSSIGISFYPAHADNIDTLLRQADSAMYQAKNKGRSQYAIYNQRIDDALIKSQQMTIDLQNALKQQQFFIEYQPRVDIHKQKIVSFEALVRWQHPKLGLIKPDQFIPVAEESGNISEIGHWVMQQACKQLAQWQKNIAPDLMISINLSPIQFNSQTLLLEITNIIKETGVKASHIEFEITEQALINNASRAIKVTTYIKDIGCSLSIDDFGTGYSSLKQLKQLPVDLLKIDQSFVSEMLINSDDEAIIKASIELAHNLDLKVVAEGVENSEQANRLKELSCDELQGYYFGNPMLADECSKILQRELKPI